jgi:hypothetical protein
VQVRHDVGSRTFRAALCLIEADLDDGRTACVACDFAVTEKPGVVGGSPLASIAEPGTRLRDRQIRHVAQIGNERLVA